MKLLNHLSTALSKAKNACKRTMQFIESSSEFLIDGAVLAVTVIVVWIRNKPIRITSHQNINCTNGQIDYDHRQFVHGSNFFPLESAYGVTFVTKAFERFLFQIAVTAALYFAASKLFRWRRNEAIAQVEAVLANGKSLKEALDQNASPFLPVSVRDLSNLSEPTRRDNRARNFDILANYIQSGYSTHLLSKAFREIEDLIAARDQAGNTLLHVAVGSNNVPVIRMLRARAKDLLDVENHASQRAVHVANRKTSHTARNLLSQYEVTKRPRRTLSASNVSSLEEGTRRSNSSSSSSASSKHGSEKRAITVSASA